MDYFLPTGLPLLREPIRISTAEECCGDAAQQWSANPGESHTEATAPSAGETCMVPVYEKKVYRKNNF